MPELNLEALKSKKRSTKKYRPYDIPEPSKQEASPVLQEQISISPKLGPKAPEQVIEQKKPEPIKTKSERNLPKVEKNAPSKSDAELEQEIKAKLEAEYERKLKEKELELAIQYKKDNEDDHLPAIVTTSSDDCDFNLDKDKISNSSLYKILKTSVQWNSPTQRLFMFFLKKTEFGTLKDVQIGRKEIEHEGAHGRYFKDTRDFLSKMGFLSYRDGYIGTTKKRGTFYTIHTGGIFDK